MQTGDGGREEEGEEDEVLAELKKKQAELRTVVSHTMQLTQTPGLKNYYEMCLDI